MCLGTRSKRQSLRGFHFPRDITVLTERSRSRLRLVKRAEFDSHHWQISADHMMILHYLLLVMLQDEYLSRHPQEPKEGNPWINAWNMIDDPDYNLDGDPLPAWMRAKRAIVSNWDAIEQLNGNRQQTIDRIGAYTEQVNILHSYFNWEFTHQEKTSCQDECLGCLGLVCLSRDSIALCRNISLGDG